MRRLLNWLSRKRFPYEPLISISISRSRLIHNLDEFRKFIPTRAIAPVLKSNAYGHGLYEVARILEHEPHLPFFVVDSYFEALALRSRGIRKPLLIIGYTRPRTIVESNLRQVSFTVTSLDTLKSIHETGARVRIHLKIDTGMHRQGILMDEVPFAIELIRSNPCIFLEGICTHFGDADNDDETFTESQIAHWNHIVREFKKSFPHLWYMHASNTDGSRFSEDIHANVIRLGLGLYGLSANKKLTDNLHLQPALEMTTSITGLKMLMKGETIGYGNTFTAPDDLCTAVIPVGYYEALDRRLSNNGFVLVGERRIPCPIIGRISMNITTIDVSSVPGQCELKMGLPVIVISRETGDGNSVRSIAERCGIIDYEVVVRIPQHLKRVITA